MATVWSAIGGYLVGMLAAAVIVGAAERGRDRVLLAGSSVSGD